MNKAFSLINIAGLSIGMASTLLIMVWIYNEKSWDRYNENYSSVYHVKITRNFNGALNTGDDMMYPLSKAAKESLPEVEYATNVTFGENTLFSAGDKRLNKSTVTASPDFFNVFSFETVQGNARKAIQDPDAVILTESSAIALFGHSNVVGEEVEVNNHRTAIVKAVVKDVPTNSTMQFDAVIPVNPSSQAIKDAENDWVNCGRRVFFKTREGAAIAGLEKKVLDLVKDRTGSDNPTTRGSIILHPMEKWRLYSEFTEGKNTGGRIEYVNLFSCIAVIILIIACVNFMNLSTARSEKRAKEVGIRKTLGSARNQLLGQFLAESMVISLLALILAVMTVFLVLPAFENILKLRLEIPYRDAETWIIVAVLVVVTGFLAGSYPAFYLSAFNPVRVLKGTFLPGPRGMVPRKVLVTFQFIVSIILISATLIIYKQLQYVKDRDLGYDQDRLLMVNSSPQVDRSYEALKNDLMQTGMVEAVNRTSGPVTNIFMYTSGIQYPKAPANSELVIGFAFSSDDFIRTMKGRLLAGRDFKPGDSNTVIFNKEAIRTMGLEDPVGKEITWAGKNRRIIGVMDNMVMISPFESPSPFMASYEDKWSSRLNVRLAGGADVKKAVAAVGTIFKKYSTEYPYEYRFVNDEFNEKFNTEKLIGQLSVILAGLAIFICCLGLFGLVATSIERRTKEIGIRKVLGASVRSLLFLISREFLLLVIIAFGTAIPAAWWGMNRWLENYAYRIDIGIGLFLLVGLVLLFIVGLTVSLNASRAALNNPVKSLRAE
jgi:putative ABC transport system permease protein